MIKWIIRALISIIVIIGFLIALMMTSVGLNLGLQIAKKAIPGKLNCSTAYGIPTGLIKISNLNYRYHGLEIAIDRLYIKWQPFYLLKGVLCITQLNTDNIRIILPQIKDIKNRFSFNISIHQGFLKNLSVKYPSYKFICFKNILLNQIECNHTLSANIQAQATQPYPMNIYLHSNGTRDNYHFSIQAKNKDINWKMTGKGTCWWMELQTHETHTLNGHLNAFVKMHFSPILHWNINVDMAHLNLRKFNKNWPKQLTVQLKTKGEHKIGNFPNFTLTGTLKTPKTYVHVVGQHYKKWDLAVTTSATNSHSFFTTEKGTLRSSVLLSDYRIDTLKRRWNIGATFNHQDPIISTSIQHVHVCSHQFFSIKTNTNEQINIHHIKVDVLMYNSQIGKTTINLLLDVNLQNKAWRGTFSQIKIHSQKLGEWNASHSSIFTIIPDRITISPILLYSGLNHLCLQGYWQTAPVQKINGNLTINSDDASIIKLFLPNTIQLHGRLIARCAISGRTDCPLVNSTFQLKEGNINFPQFQVSLTQVRGSVTSTTSTINYRLKGYSKNQPIQITGQTRLDMPSHPTTFTIHGENLLIVNNHQYIIYGSGTLKIDIIGHNINIIGTLTVPHAILKPTTLTHISVLTEDVVFLGTNKKQIPWQTNINIKIILGNKILLNSLGVKGRLIGELTLLKPPKQVMISNGRINIIDATFTAHGLILDINPHSAVIFIRSPINNPMLSVRATRTLKISPIISLPQLSGSTVRIGFDVEGTLNHPEISLYSSDPKLTQSDILSFLIFGHSANVNTSDNVNILADAIDTLNISGKKTLVKGVINQITKSLGLTELGIESQTTIADIWSPINHTSHSAFVVGRYLSPRVYIRYSRGIRTSINIIQIRYLINQNLVIQTETSSLGNGVDVLYSLERH